MPPTTRRRNGIVRGVTNRRVTKPVSKDVLVELTLKHNKACMFCGCKEISEKLYGPLYQLNDIVVHYFCILLSSQAVQKGEDKEGIWGFLYKDIKSELDRGSREACFYCKKPGATISCYGSKCRKIFHLPCGIINGSMHQYFQAFKSFCQQHRITQAVDLDELQSSTPVQCTICREDVIPTPIPTSLWAPCCKRNAWFHRSCIQDLALSAGYFFKCPLCNDHEKFKYRMLTLGIYIPSRDASWETVPDAYAELLERHSSCDAEKCLCPYQDQRNYQQDSGSWEIILCHTCGSKGTHLLCSSLKCEQQWFCSSCQNILSKDSPDSNVAKRRRLEIPNDSNDVSSPPLNDEKKQLTIRPTTSSIHNLRRTCMRETTSNTETREPTRLNNNNNKETINHEPGPSRPMPPWTLNKEPIVISSDDDDDDDVQCISYVDPPIVPKLDQPRPGMPIIQSVTSMSTANNNVRNRLIHHNPLRAMPLFICESIDLTSDDETTA